MKHETKLVNIRLKQKREQIKSTSGPVPEAENLARIGSVVFPALPKNQTYLIYPYQNSEKYSRKLRLYRVSFFTGTPPKSSKYKKVNLG